MMNNKERRELFEEWLLQCPVDHAWQGYGKKLKGRKLFPFQLEEDRSIEIYSFYPLPEESEDEED